MTRKTRCFLSGLLCAVLLAGCGPAGTSSADRSETPPSGPSSSNSSDVSMPSVSGPENPHGAIPLKLPQGETIEGTVVEYTWDHPVTMDGGRKLTLRLRCEAEYWANSWHYGVRAMDLLEGENCLQTMTVLLADAAACGLLGEDPEHAYERTDCWEKDGDLILEDLNFDGIPDLRLLKTTGVVNSVYLCWLWDPDFQMFRFAFSLWGYDVEVNPEQKRIITTARDAQTHITNYYEYDEKGTLRLVDTESITPGRG